MEMSEHRFSFPACVIAGKGRIDAHDVMMLRRHAFADGISRKEDAEALLALHHACPEQCPEWGHYFVETLASFIVHASAPAGHIDELKAGWMIRALAEEGVVRTPLELELLFHAIEISVDVADGVTAFALDQIRNALAPVPGGAYLATRPPAAAITQHDLAYIWRLLRPAVDRGRLLLSPLEAEVLKEIDHLTSSSLNHPDWNEMLSQVVTLERPADLLRSLRWTLDEDDDFVVEERAA
jgi:hypothetical protein